MYIYTRVLSIACLVDCMQDRKVEHDNLLTCLQNDIPKNYLFLGAFAPEALVNQKLYPPQFVLYFNIILHVIFGVKR